MIEQTYSMVKPDAFSKKDEILALVKKGGFKIIRGKDMKFNKEIAEEFYIEHKDKGFFEDLIGFMTSGMIHAFVVEKENAILSFREFIGATNPAKAKEGTIRKLFGAKLSRNAIHGSDAPASAEREIRLVFPE